MEKTQKNVKRNIFSKFFMSFFAVILSLASVLFVACAEEASANTGYDSYGNIRLATPTLEFFEKTKEGAPSKIFSAYE